MSFVSTQINLKVSKEDYAKYFEWLRSRNQIFKKFN